MFLKKIAKIRKLSIKRQKNSCVTMAHAFNPINWATDVGRFLSSRPGSPIEQFP